MMVISEEARWGKITGGGQSRDIQVEVDKRTDRKSTRLNSSH